MENPFLNKNKVRHSAHFLVDNFIRGIIVIAPVGITIGIIMWIFKFIDDILPNIIQFFLNIIFINKPVHPPHIFGLGFLVFIILITVVGYFSSFFLFNKLMHIADKQLTRMSGVKVVYTTIKELIKTFQNNNKNFDRPVLFSIDARKEVWRIGFITTEDLEQFGLDKEFIAVYAPMSLSVAGEVYIVKKSNLQRLKNIPPADAMKFLISGGLVNRTKEEMSTNDTKKTQ